MSITDPNKLLGPDNWKGISKPLYEEEIEAALKNISNEHRKATIEINEKGKPSSEKPTFRVTENVYIANINGELKLGS